MGRRGLMLPADCEEYRGYVFRVRWVAKESLIEGQEPVDIFRLDVLTPPRIVCDYIFCPDLYNGKVLVLGDFLDDGTKFYGLLDDIVDTLEDYRTLDEKEIEERINKIKQE